MKLFPGIWIGALMTLLIHRIVDECHNTAHLEVYTLENIYYINGLKVTNENNNDTLVFESQEELSKYISDKTSNDNQAGYDCLK